MYDLIFMILSVITTARYIDSMPGGSRGVIWDF